jgi:CRP/FNR family transcriptional regulator
MVIVKPGEAACMESRMQTAQRRWPNGKKPGSDASPCAPRNPAERYASQRDAIAKLEREGERTSLSECDLLVREGQPGDETFTVVEGALMLYKSLPGGRRQVVGFRFPGELVTMRRCGSTWPVSVSAITPCYVNRLPCHAFRSLVESDQEVCQTLLDMAGDEIAARQEQLLTVGRKNTVERIAAFILEIWRRTQRWPARIDEVLLPMNRAAIADYLGLKTETVSRAFARLVHEEILALPRPSHVVVLDRPALEELAAGRQLLHDETLVAGE